MKQFKNLILAGALVLGLAGFAVSCDKYGDDIDELRDKVNTLASKDELSSQIASLQSALSAASAEASQASAEAAAAKAAADKASADAKSAGDAAAAAAAEANAAKAAADKASADAKQAAIEALQSELETLKADLKEATDAQLAEFEKKVNAATEKVEALIGKVAGMVTSVELVTSFTANPLTAANTVLKFSTANEQDNVFEEDIANAITFKKGNQVQTPTAFIVRVSPTNAALTPEMISLVNSQGKNLDDMVTIKSVKKFSGLLTRAAENSGLWEVEVELTQYDKDEFAAATKTKINGADKSILYAVQVNNTPTAEETASRYVTSSYDLTLDWEEYGPVDELNYFVNDWNIKNINNRYAFKNAGNNCKSLPEYNGTAIPYKELTWKTSGKTAVAGNKDNTQPDSNDNRYDKSAYPAIQGEDIVISLTKNDTKIEAPENIRAMYVTLDYEENAVESAPSEWNAWNSYKYTGLNSVVEGTEVTITINPGEGQTIIDDYIGFRVYAVNYDGTLVDPDGKAFYVKVGNPAQDWSNVNTVIIPNSTLPTAEESADEAVTLTKLTGATKAEWKTDKIDGTTPVFNAVFEDKDGNVLYRASSANASPAGVDFSKVAKIHTVPIINNWVKYVDNKTYNGTLTIYNADGFVLATINVSMTKQLPTAPEGFSVKTNQLDANGVYNCYLIPSKDGLTESWAATKAEYGLMRMNDVFNWGDGEKAQYVISFADALTDPANSTKTKAKELKGNEDLTVEKKFIDNKTQHATTVYYNYGKISSETKDATGAITDYKVTVKTFPTVFNCIYNGTYTWHWGTAEEVKEKYTTAGWTGKNAPITELEYGSDYTFATPNGTAYSFDAVILGVSSRDGKYSAWLNEPYGGNPYNSSLELDLTKTHVISKGNGVEDEYFKVEKDSGNRLYFKATAISENTNPTAKVLSTLKLVYKDMYEHDVVIELDMTVVPR